MKAPFYILALLVALFISSIMLINTYETNLAKNTQKLKRYKELSSRLQTLKANWANSQAMLQKVDSIVKYAGVNDATITQSANEYRVVIKKIDIKTTHRLLNKLFNEHINLASLSITRDSLSFSIGISK